LHYIIFYLLLVLGNKVTINALAYTYFPENQIYTDLINNFNNYAKDENKDIKLELNLLTPANSSNNINDYGLFLESVLQKETVKNENAKNFNYDIIFYDPIYSYRFGPYLLDLKKILPKSHIDMYNQKILNETSFYEDKLVGIVSKTKFSYNIYIMLY